MTETEHLREALLPCPFCGSAAEHENCHSARLGREYFQIFCSASDADCGSGACVSGNTIDEATKRWNRRAALAATPPGAERWMPIEIAPTNRRIFAYGWHTSADPIYDEEAMVWKDRMDGQFYYAPQGGKLNWTPTHWMPLHDAPAPPSPAAGEK